MLDWLKGPEAQAILPVYGAVLASILGLVKLYEAFWKDRLRLATSYFLTQETGGTHEITIVNLSPVPVHVAAWALTWRPKWHHFWLEAVDATPDEPGRFRVEGRGEITLEFGGLDQFQWNHRVASGRHLILYLSVFGRRRRVHVVIGGGQ